MMRPLIPYDLEGPSAPPAPSQSHTRRPPNKKRKRHQNPPKAVVQHWDDPGSVSVGVVYDDHEGSANPAVPTAAADNVEVDEDEDEDEYGDGDDNADIGEEEEESRALTHDEIWDDAALIDAWNSAEAEYEVPFHPV